jgi:hypothetical protein
MLTTTLIMRKSNMYKLAHPDNSYEGIEHVGHHKANDRDQQTEFA